MWYNYLLPPWLYRPLRALASLTDTHPSLSTAFYVQAYRKFELPAAIVDCIFAVVHFINLSWYLNIQNSEPLQLPVHLLPDLALYLLYFSLFPSILFCLAFICHSWSTWCRFFKLYYSFLNHSQSLQIMVPFPVHEPHCIETQFTHLPSKEQKQRLSKLGVHLTYKKFTSSDDKVIYKNWRRLKRIWKKDDLIKSHISKGTDRQPFSTLSKLLETGCLCTRHTSGSVSIRLDKTTNNPWKITTLLHVLQLHNNIASTNQTLPLHTKDMPSHQQRFYTHNLNGVDLWQLHNFPEISIC